MELVLSAAWWIAIGTIGLVAFGIVGGISAACLDLLRRSPEPTEHDVQHAAEQYRTYYGSDALSVIGDHMLAATFAPDGRHKRFLKRVTAELMREEGIVEGVPLDKMDGPED